ncbi:MAG: hypothetical protein HRU09_09815 [Oligoflexales bacterium]|nr:hypothetical protein [Oligoflexales bacterium]
MVRLFALVWLSSYICTASLHANIERNLHLGFTGNIQVSPNGLAAFVEKYLNVNLNEVSSLIKTIEIDDMQLYKRENDASLLPGTLVDLKDLKISQMELSNTQVKCLSRNCVISLPIKSLSIDAKLVLTYFNMPITFSVNFGLRDHPDLLSWIHLNVTLNTEGGPDSLVFVDYSKSSIKLASNDSFFFQIRNNDNGYQFDDSLLNTQILGKLVEDSINKFALAPAEEALSSQLNDNESLRYFLEKFISLSLPNIDLNGQIDFSNNERIQSKIRDMLSEYKNHPEPNKAREIHKYVKKYRKYLENNNIYSYYVICFLNEILSVIDRDFSDELPLVKDEIKTIFDKTNDSLEKSKRSTFLKLELRRDEQEDNMVDQPYAMSLFLLGNDNEPPGFRDIVRHGKLYSANEHFVIGGLLNILKSIKLNAKKLIPKAKSEQAVRMLQSYHIEWRKISKSLIKTSSSEFSEYVLSLLNAIRNHCIYCEKSNHATSILSSVMMLTTFFEDLNLKSKKEEVDNFHARFILPIRFFNRYMNYLYKSKQFEKIQVDFKEKDILIEDARDLNIKFESAPVIRWDSVNSKFLISIKDVSASLLVSNKPIYPTRLSIDFHFVPDINADGEIYFRFHKLSSDMAFLPKRNDKFVNKILGMISMWTILPQAIKLTVIRHIAYKNIKAFLTNLRFPLPDLYIGGDMNLSPSLNSIKYNQDHIFLELKLNQIYKG